MKLTSAQIAAGLAGAASSASAFQWPNCATGLLATNQVCNTSLAPAERAAALVAALTIAEKTANLVNRAPGAPRIGLPAYEWWNEALHGVASSPGVSFAASGQPFAYATSFAMPITMSAAFDDDLIHRVATTVSTEGRAFANNGRGGLDFWTPNINPYKDPRWGRGSETPGEDPFRIKGYVKALISGLEGDQKIRKVIATCKHYAGYDMERWQGVVRYGFNALISTQDLSEYYMPPFQTCARDSKVGSIMCSYNSINGIPACANSYIQNDILRKHWGWTDDDNYITSDCNAVQDFYNKRNFTLNAAQSAAAAFNGGMDTICEVPGSNSGSNVIGAYTSGQLTEAAIDRSLKRLYRGLIKAGYFDPPNSSEYRSLGWANVGTAEAQALAIESAAKGIVLKKNDGTLPLNFANKTASLIGHWARGGYNMLGGYSGTPPYYIDPVTAATTLGINFNYATGPVNQTAIATDTWTLPALTAALTSDVIIYFGGSSSALESEDRDRYSIALPAAQQMLIDWLATLGKPLVVVQLGDQTDDTSLLRNPNISAIVWAGFPGQAGGQAVFDVLTGKTAPAGRLPVTQYPASYTDKVSLLDMTLRPSAKNPGRTYRWYNDSVLPFGHGLHYTTFLPSFQPGTGVSNHSYSIADLKANCTAAYPDLCAFTSIPIRVANTGNTTSDFVALAFLAGEHGPTPYPIKSLAAYTRLSSVKPGATAEAALALTLGALARTDEKGNTVLYPGSYRLLLEVPTRDEVTFTLVGDPWVLDEFPQPPSGS